jgi:hypothetical protein
MTVGWQVTSGMRMKKKGIFSKPILMHMNKHQNLDDKKSQNAHFKIGHLANRWEASD